MSDPVLAAWIRKLGGQISDLQIAVDEMTFVGMSADMADQFASALDLARQIEALAETGCMPLPPPHVHWNTG